MSWLDSPGEIASILAIGGIVVGVLLYVIDTRIGKVLSEFKPNGGASTKDQLDRIEAKIDGHINWHMSQKGR